MLLTDVHVPLFLLLLAFSIATRTSAWIQSDPGLRCLRSKAGTARRAVSPCCSSSWALSMSSRGSFGNPFGRPEDGPGESAEEKEARAIADAARRHLERMWSSSSAAGGDPRADGQGDGVAGRVDERAEQEAKLEAELNKRVVEDRRETPFPTSSERGALEAALATQKGLVDGEKGLIIDVEVRQMDDTHPEFDPDLLIHFVGEVCKYLAMVAGRTKVMYKGDTLAARATLAFKKDNNEAAGRGIDPRNDVSFCSFLAPTFSNKELDDGDVDPDRELANFARGAASQFEENDKLLVVVGPRTPADVAVLRRLLKAIKPLPVVVINPRMSFNPRAMTRYETTYLLRQFAVIPIKTDPRVTDLTRECPLLPEEKRRMAAVALMRNDGLGTFRLHEAAMQSPLEISMEQRRQEHVTCELGQVVPKVLVTRSFPDDYKLYIDLDGLGFRLMKTFERKPMVPILCLTAQVIVSKHQREVSRKLRLEERRERERKWAQAEKDRDDDDDDDEDDDTDVHIVNRRLTKAEKAAIDAKLRD